MMIEVSFIVTWHKVLTGKRPKGDKKISCIIGNNLYFDLGSASLGAYVCIIHKIYARFVHLPVKCYPSIKKTNKSLANSENPSVHVRK